METINVRLTARPDPAIEAARIEKEARQIFQAGFGETNDYDVLARLAEMCRIKDCEIDVVRPETHKDGTYHEVHFGLWEVDIVLREDIEIRPGPYYQMT